MTLSIEQLPLSSDGHTSWKVAHRHWQKHGSQQESVTLAALEQEAKQVELVIQFLVFSGTDK
jgi:hypothetical protein